MSIKFGTDGWRAIIAQEYTYDNLSKVAIATAKFFKKNPKIKSGVCIGYDTRFMSSEFARHVAQVFSSQGVTTYLSDSALPTPAVSLFVRDKNLAGGVVITASHNPPIYNGFKVKGDYGGPALPSMIDQIESILAHVDSNQYIGNYDEKLIKEESIKKYYTDNLMTVVDIDLIASKKMKIAHHVMYGSGNGILRSSLHGTEVVEYHAEVNPSFGGINPEPIPRYISDFVTFYNNTGDFDVAIINDGDADRIGMLDEKGNFVDAHLIFSLILDYIVTEKGERGEVAKTFTLTNIIDRICEKKDLTLHILPVGFKHVGKMMQTNNILIGGEESGGLALNHYIPERDGAYIGLVILEIMAKKGKKLSELIAELFKTYGALYFDRVDIKLTQKEKERTLEKVSGGKITNIAGFKVDRYEDLDGSKYFFENGWMLVRPSGTEPVVRFYAESDSRENVKRILEFARNLPNP